MALRNPSLFPAFLARPQAGALVPPTVELGAAVRVRISPAPWLLLPLVGGGQRTLCYGRGVEGPPGCLMLRAWRSRPVSPLPPVPTLRTGKVELGCGELLGSSTLSLLPPVFLPFSPSSPFPSPSRCSVAHPKPPTTFLPPLRCSSLSVTRGDIVPAGPLAAPSGKPNAWACPGPPHCPPRARQTAVPAPGWTLTGVPSRQGSGWGCPWHGDGSGSAGEPLGVLFPGC